MSAFHPTFVSHAHADNALCDRYIAALKTQGIDVWYDRISGLGGRYHGGHDLDREIQRELQQRSAYLLLMTETAMQSFWVQLETETYRYLMSQDRSRILLPVRIGPCQVPPTLSTFSWIDAQAMPFDQAINSIANALLAPGASPLQPPSKAHPKIFVSHSTLDAPFASKLVRDLNVAGAKAWMDSNDLGPGNFQQRISEALADCEWFLLVLTRNALSSGWVRQEVDAANQLKHQKRINELIFIKAADVGQNELPALWGVFNIFDATTDYALTLTKTLKAVGL